MQDGGGLELGHLSRRSVEFIHTRAPVSPPPAKSAIPAGNADRYLSGAPVLVSGWVRYIEYVVITSTKVASLA